MSDQPVYVYFISSGASPIIIGVSSNPARYLATLQEAHYKRLHLLFTVACKDRLGAVALAQALHEFFKSDAIANGWFSITPANAYNTVCLLKSLADAISDVTLHVSQEELQALEKRASLKARSRVHPVNKASTGEE